MRRHAPKNMNKHNRHAFGDAETEPIYALSMHTDHQESFRFSTSVLFVRYAYLCTDMRLDMCLEMCIEPCIEPCIELCIELCIEPCIELCIELYIELCIEPCIELYTDKCIELYTDKCIDVCIELCIDVCTDMCVHICAGMGMCKTVWTTDVPHGHVPVYRLMCRHVYRRLLRSVQSCFART